MHFEDFLQPWKQKNYQVGKSKLEKQKGRKKGNKLRKEKKKQEEKIRESQFFQAIPRFKNECFKKNLDDNYYKSQYQNPIQV